MRLHPLCKLFPQVSDSELADLAADIKANGLRDPIVTLDDQILDGQNRFRACEIAGVRPQFDPYIGDNPVGYVISKNIARRHLTASQRAMIAAELVTTKWGGKRQSKSKRESNPLENPVITTEQAAKALNTDESLVRRGNKVKAKSAKLAKVVTDGGVSIGTAQEAMKAPKKRLDRAIAKGPKALKKLASEMSIPATQVQPDGLSKGGLAADSIRAQRAEISEDEAEAAKEAAIQDDIAAGRATVEPGADGRDPDEAPRANVPRPEPNAIDLVEAVYAIHKTRWNDGHHVPAPREVIDAIIKALKLAGFQGTERAV